MPHLEFLGRGEVHSHHLSVNHRTIEIVKQKSHPKKGESPSLDDNLIINGDNLLALKALLPRYEGKINCIYIDPPYNTGNEGWKYNDKVRSPLMKDWLKKVVALDDQARHDKWLCMMWPRLNLLKDLLADDGVIFISIDDNEQHHLRMMMDEIFGEENFVATLIHQRAKGGGQAENVVKGHDYIHIYSKNKKEAPKLRREKIIQGKIIEKNNREYLVDDDCFRKVFGKYDRSQDRRCFYEELEELKGLDTKQEVDRGIKDGTYFLKKHKDTGKQIICKLVPLDSLKSKFYSIVRVLSEDGKNELESLKIDFSYPKPVELIRNLIYSISKKDSLILDSFAGSGTTAHATLALNKEDGGNRKFILVECEDYADDITAERVRRVIKGIPQAKEQTLKKGLGGSFTFCKLGKEINIDKMLTGESLPDYETLAQHIFWTATGETLPEQAKQREDGFVGESKQHRLYLFYEPNVQKLTQLAFTGNMAQKIMDEDKSKKKRLVFAPHTHIGEKELRGKRIVFCQLPWAIYERKA